MALSTQCCLLSAVVKALKLSAPQRHEVSQGPVLCLLGVVEPPYAAVVCKMGALCIVTRVGPLAGGILIRLISGLSFGQCPGHLLGVLLLEDKKKLV